MKIVLLVALCGLAVATPSGRDSLYYVDDILEPSYYGVGILDQIRGALNRFLNQAESLIDRRPDIQVDLADRIAELRAQIQSTVDLSVDEAGDVLSRVRSGITSLARDITKRLKQRPSSLSKYGATLESVKTLSENLDFDADQRLGELFLGISEILLKSNRGLAALREYAHQKITSNHPVAMLLKQYVQYASDDALKTLFGEMFKNLETFYGVYDDAGDLGSLFREVRGIVDTEEGLRVVKAYALDLETSHPIVLRIKAFLVNADDDEVKEVLDALFQGLDYSSSIQYGFRDVIETLRDELIKEHNVVKFRDYAKKLRPNHTTVLLVKNFVLEATEVDLKEFILELFQGVNFFQLSDNDGVSLSELVKQLKIYVLSERGHAVVRQYFEAMETTHPVVLRLKASVTNSNDDDLQSILIDFFEPLEKSSATWYYRPPYETLFVLKV